MNPKTNGVAYSSTGILGVYVRNLTIFASLLLALQTGCDKSNQTNSANSIRQTNDPTPQDELICERLLTEAELKTDETAIDIIEKMTLFKSKNTNFPIKTLASCLDQKFEIDCDIHQNCSIENRVKL